jgi:hypothetical protein
VLRFNKVERCKRRDDAMVAELQVWWRDDGAKKHSYVSW